MGSSVLYAPLDPCSVHIDDVTTLCIMATCPHYLYVRPAMIKKILTLVCLEAKKYRMRAIIGSISVSIILALRIFNKNDSVDYLKVIGILFVCLFYGGYGPVVIFNYWEVLK